MAKSKIIKELVTGKIDLFAALKQTKVLLYKFKKPEIHRWVDNELSGYSQNDKLPDYRIVKGELKGNFIIGYCKYTNCSIPIEGIDEEAKYELENIQFYQSICSLQNIIRGKDRTIAKSIPSSCYQYLTKFNNISAIITASVVTNKLYVSDMLSTIESKLIDILLMLESEFGSLDDLDIMVENREDEVIHKIENNICLLLFQDNSIKIGDNNDIKKSEILSNSNNK